MDAAIPLPGTPQRAFPTGFGPSWPSEEERSIEEFEPGRVGPESRGDTPRLGEKNAEYLSDGQ
jgi:hypothetical protein